MKKHVHFNQCFFEVWIPIFRQALENPDNPEFISGLSRFSGVTTDDHIAIFDKMKSYRFIRSETCFLYVKIHFRPVGKIKTTYFMIDEENHKKRRGRLLAMTSSSTTQNFISLSQLLTSWRCIQSLTSDHLYTMSETIMGIYCVNFRSINIAFFFFFLEITAPLNR